MDAAFFVHGSRGAARKCSQLQQAGDDGTGHVLLAALDAAPSRAAGLPSLLERLRASLQFT
jgi:hypothetical protein